MRNNTFFFLLLFTSMSFSQNNDSLKAIAYGKGKDSIKIDALNKLFFYEVNSNINTSKKYYNDIFKIAKAKNSDFAYARAYNCKGVFWDYSGKMDSAYSNYYKSIKYSRKAKAKSVEGSAFNNIGLLDWNKGDYYRAIQNFNKALKIFETINRQDLIANAYSNIGLIYDELDDNVKAIEYLNKSIEIRKTIKDNYGLSVSYVNIAKSLGKQKQYALSIENYKKSIEIKRKIDDFSGIAIANYGLSTALVHLKKYDEALTFLKEAEQICIKNNSESNIVKNVYYGFTDLYINTNNLEQAKKYNQKFFDIIEKIDDKDRLSDYYNNESEIALKEKDFEKAYLYHDKYDSLISIITGLELKKAVNQLEIKYQTEKKEKLLIQKEAEAKHKNTTIIILVLTSFFIGLVGFLIYRQQKLKNKQQEQEFELKQAIAAIESQNNLHEQRLSISRDLHDNIGAQLTFIISSVDNLKFGNKKIDDKVNNQLSKISNFTKSTIIELRDTIWAMNSNEFSFEDLRSRIFNFIEKAQSAKEEVIFKFIIDDDLKDSKLSSVVGINVYRTIQEAINNAMKYANATQIEVYVKEIGDKIQIQIVDNGKGFQLNEVDLGNGIMNMKKRIEDINGDFVIHSQLEKGTTISINFDQ